jgi:CrcB protein
VVNISGSLLLGFLMRYALGSTSVSAEARALLTTGFCGGYTTFSTFAQETLDLVEAHDVAIALVSVSANVVLGVLAVLLGARLGRVA